MKSMLTVLLIFGTLHAKAYIPDALFATVVHVGADDTLSIREQPDYYSRKLGAFPNDARVYLDRCTHKGHSHWCHVHPDSLVDYGGTAGWVNARYLSFGKKKRSPSISSARATSDRILYALQKHAYTKLAPYIHPIKGLILTEMVSFADTHRLHFTRSAFIQALKSTKVFYWGDTYGRGDPIRMNLTTYLNRLAQRQTPSKVKTLSMPTKSFPLKSTQPRQGLEYYWIKTKSKTREYDWKGLVLILEQYRGRWYLIGVMRDRWTI